MPRFNVKATETLEVETTITVTAKDAEAAKRKLEKIVDGRCSTTDLDRWDANYVGAVVLKREVKEIKKLPSKAEYRAIQEENDRRMNLMDDRIRKHIAQRSGPKTRILVQFSAGDFEDEEQDRPDLASLDKVPVKGKVVIYDEDSGYMSHVMDDPSWLHLCGTANEQIVRSDDTDHVFLESINEERIRDVPKWVKERDGLPDSITFCTFGFGS